MLGDARVFRPFAEFSRARWHETHERTTWNPYVFAGIPATASLADPRPQYLPGALIDLYERVRQPRRCPLAGPLLIALAGMLATAGLARALWGVGAAGMCWAALAWGLGPVLIVPLVFGHDAQFVSSSLVPVCLLAVHGVFAARRAAAAALLLALAIAIQCLTGHPQVVVYGAMLVIVFALERARRFARAPRLAWVAAAGALGAAMSAAVWWPAFLYSAHSLRGGLGTPGVSLAEVAKYSLGVGDVLAMAWPRVVGLGGADYWGGMHANDYPRFVGATVIALALAGGLGRRDRGGAGAWWAIVLGAIALAMGTQLGVLYGALHAIVPLGSRFRVPSVVLVAAHLGLALLSARALAAPSADTSAAQATGPPRKPTLALGIAAAVLALGLALALGPLSGVYVYLARGARPDMAVATAASAARSAGVDLILRLVLVVGALFLLSRCRRLGERWLAAIVVLMAIDLATITIPFVARGTGTSEQLAAPAPPALAEIGRSDPTARVSSARLEHPGTPAARAVEFYTNDWIPWRAHALGGTHGAVPSAWRIASNLTRSLGAMRALGVTYMSSNAGAPWDSAHYAVVATADDEIVYRLRGALGRAYPVERVLALGSDVAVVRAMMLPDFPPERVALSADPADAQDYPGASSCRIRWVRDDPDRIELDVEAPAPAFVVVADSHDPGWRADVDGRPTRIARVDLLVRGVALPAGRHRMTMRYQPEGWAQAVPITRVACATWIALALAWVALRRRFAST